MKQFLHSLTCLHCLASTMTAILLAWKYGHDGSILQLHLVQTGVSGVNLILKKQYPELLVQVFLNITATRSIP